MKPKVNPKNKIKSQTEVPKDNIIANSPSILQYFKQKLLLGDRFIL